MGGRHPGGTRGTRRQGVSALRPGGNESTEIAEALSEALGQTITYIPISVEEFAQTLTNRGFGAHIVQHLSNVAVDYRNGVFAGTNDIVETIGKRKPTGVVEFAIRNKEFLVC